MIVLFSSTAIAIWLYLVWETLKYRREALFILRQYGCQHTRYKPLKDTSNTHQHATHCMDCGAPIGHLWVGIKQ